MSKFLQILTLAFAVVFFATSCTKSTDKFTPYTTAELNDVNWSSDGITDAKAKQIINLLAKPAFSSAFNVSNNAVIDIDNSVQIALPSNSYLLNGSSYTTGNVNFTVKELMSKGDFVRNLFSSTNGTSIQETKGAFLLNLTDNSGTNLTLVKDTTYNIRLVDSNLSQDCKLFVGTQMAANQGSVNWGMVDGSAGNFMQPTSIIIQGVNKPAYQITTKQLSWVSIAKPLVFSDYVNGSVVLPKNFTNKTTIVFAIFSDYNVVLQLLPDYSSKTYLMENIPSGVNVKLISISYIDNQFYIGKQDITTSKVAQYSLNPAFVPISIADINSFLDGL